MGDREPIGYVALRPSEDFAIWTGRLVAKLYVSRASATAAMKNSGRREGQFRIAPVFLEV